MTCMMQHKSNHVFTTHNSVGLKEDYEIVGESSNPSGYFPTHSDFFLQKCISNHQTKQSSKFQSDLSDSQSTFEIIHC